MTTYQPFVSNKPAAKKSPSSFQFLLLTIGVSLGIHGILMWVPMGGGTAKVPEVKSEPITITQNPPAPREAANVPVTGDAKTANQKPGAKKTATAKATTSKVATSRANISITNRKSAATTANISIAKPNLGKTPSSQTVTATTRQTPVINVAKVTPSTNNSLPALPASSGTLEGTVRISTNLGRNPNPGVLAEFLQTLAVRREPFPNYPGSVVGCSGIPFCYSVATDAPRVINYLSQEFQARDYDMTLETDEGDRKIYKLTKGSNTQFLTVVADSAKTTYLFAPTAYTRADLQNAAQIFAQYQTILAQAAGSGSEVPQAKPEDFSNPSLYYTLEPEEGQNASKVLKPNAFTAGGFPFVRNQSPESSLKSTLVSALEAQNFQVSPLTRGYGGGTLVEVKKENTRFYLNLVPAKADQGTIFVTWLNSPLEYQVQVNDRFLVIR